MGKLWVRLSIATNWTIATANTFNPGMRYVVFAIGQRTLDIC